MHTSASYNKDGLLHQSGVDFDEDCQYRYSLYRKWVKDGNDILDRFNQAEMLLWVMLNPSTADLHTDDPTVRRCTNLAQREGFEGIGVVNLSAFISTDPKALKTLPRDGWWDSDMQKQKLCEFISAHNFVDAVAAWGPPEKTGVSPERFASLTGSLLFFLQQELELPVWCVGRSKEGYPRHPLMVKADVEFELM